MTKERIKDALKNKEYLKKLYSFCYKLCGIDNFPVEKFYSLLKKARAQNIWGYKGIDEYLFGFLLLTLDDFTGQTKNERTEYIFRFCLDNNKERILKKINQEIKDKNPLDLDKISKLLDNKQYFLIKVSGDGKLMNFPEGNPYPVNKETWDQLSEDYKWVRENLIDSSACIGRSK